MRFASVLLVLSLLGCQSRPAKPAANADRLAEAYVSLLRLKAKIGGSDSSVTVSSYGRQSEDSLRVHGFTKDEFKRQVESLSASHADLERFSLRVQELTGSRQSF
jgi:hypothetical protein